MLVQVAHGGDVVRRIRHLWQRFGKIDALWLWLPCWLWGGVVCRWTREQQAAKLLPIL